MPAASGLENFFQLAREAAYGTDLAATHRYPLLSHSSIPNAGLVDDMSMDGSVNEKAPIATVESVAGSLETYLDFENILLLLDGAFGTSTYGSNGGVDAGSNPYTHTFNDSKKLFNSHVFELGEGNIPSGKCAQVIGAKFTGMTLRLPSGTDPATLVLPYVGKRKTYDVTYTVGPAAGTRSLATWRHVTAATAGTGDATDDHIESIELTLTNPLLVGWTGESGQFIDEPVLNGKRTATLTMVQRRYAKALNEAYLAKTALAPSFTLTSGAKSIVVTCPAAYLTTAPDAVYGDFGVVRQTLNYKLTTNGSYSVQMVVTNTEATITTP